jgi:hypothetical protein
VALSVGVAHRVDDGDEKLDEAFSAVSSFIGIVIQNCRHLVGVI